MENIDEVFSDLIKSIKKSSTTARDFVITLNWALQCLREENFYEIK